MTRPTSTAPFIWNTRCSNGLKFFEDHDELYWNVTGDEWDVPVGNASAQIFLPQGVTGVRTNEFTGSYGSRAQNANVTASENTVEVSMSRPLCVSRGTDGGRRLG